MITKNGILTPKWFNSANIADSQCHAAPQITGAIQIILLTYLLTYGQ